MDFQAPLIIKSIESLFLAPSHHSIGIQFADLVSGAVFRHFEHQDARWYNIIEQNFWSSQKEQGGALVKILGNEKDAESAGSLDPTEPALMTQSQRTSNHSLE